MNKTYSFSIFYRKYLIYLWTKEKSGISQKAKKERKKAEWLAKKAELVEDTGEIKYGLAHNSLFLRIYPSSINHYQNAKLMQAIMFEPKVVFDCGYDSYMNMFETHNCAKQLTIAFATNRSHVNPMCLYFCNMDKEGALMRHVQRNMPNALDDDFPAFITSQSYLDLFPKEKLVYLTPHCRMDLNEYDADTVYIVGAMVDKVSQDTYVYCVSLSYLFPVPLINFLSILVDKSKTIVFGKG